MVKNLFIKRERQAPLDAVDRLVCSSTGIAGNVGSSPIRQILIIPTDVLEEFDIAPGALRENIVVDHDKLHALLSGTVLRIGEVSIRLTFHCEPCRVISNFVNIKAIQHRRGYFGRALNAGEIKLGDAVEDLGPQFPEIPNSVQDRLRWYLETHDGDIAATHLLRECGLSTGYARALPNLLRKVPAYLSRKVVYTSRARSSSTNAGHSSNQSF